MVEDAIAHNQLRAAATYGATETEAGEGASAVIFAAARGLVKTERTTSYGGRAVICDTAARTVTAGTGAADAIAADGLVVVERAAGNSEVGRSAVRDAAAETRPGKAGANAVA